MTELPISLSKCENRKVLRRHKPKIVKEVVSIISSSICPKHFFSLNEKDNLQFNLLSWYDQFQRKLPWRDIAKTEDDVDKRGYAVWVSEVMLQQTQVATVIPYYNKWMKKWPTIVSLAAATLEEVNQVWSGLGYYSRAKRLHAGAQLITSSKGGHLPQNSDELKDVPGIGKYTASAIASVAYQQVVGVVDGNVIRVLSRLRAVGSESSKPSTQDHLWKLADEIVSESRPGDFNQALMEFGAVLCTPRNPKCDSCPLKTICLAHAMEQKAKPKFLMNSQFSRTASLPLQDIECNPDCQHCIPKSLWKSSLEVTAFPVKKEKKKSRVERVAVVVVEHDGLLLMVQRPEHGLLAGLWEFPSLPLQELVSEHEQVNKWLCNIGFSSSAFKCTNVGDLVHIFSHIRTTYIVRHLMLDHAADVQNLDQNIKWLRRSEVKTAAISTAMKKVLRLVDESLKKVMKVKGSLKRKLESPSKKTQSRIDNFFAK